MIFLHPPVPKLFVDALVMTGGQRDRRDIAEHSTLERATATIILDDLVKMQHQRAAKTVVDADSRGLLVFVAHGFSLSKLERPPAAI